MKTGFILLMVLALFAMLFAGCTSNLLPSMEQTNLVPASESPIPKSSTGTIKVFVTDAPGDVTAVNITVSEVEVHKAGVGGESGQWINLANQEETFNLIELQDISLLLAGGEVEAGKYTQLRMTVFDVIVKTEGGPDEGYQATVPSDKLKFVRPFTLEAGGEINLIVDIDASKSVLFPGGKKGEPNKVIFKPVVKLMIEKGEQDSEELTSIFSPTVGPVGTLITVNEEGWVAGESIDAVTVGGVNATYALTVDGSGNLIGTITVPVLEPGVQDIVITGFSSGEQTFIDAFTVIPTAIFTPTSGTVGTEIAVTGTGWVALEVINPVTVGGVTATHTLTVDGGGNLSGSVWVPALAPGDKDIVITGASSSEQTFPDAFTVNPTATFVPFGGPVGTPITVTGAGWVAEEPINSVTVGGEVATYILTVDVSGVISGTITVPALSLGDKDIVITGASSGEQTFSNVFTVT